MRSEPDTCAEAMADILFFCQLLRLLLWIWQMAGSQNVVVLCTSGDGKKREGAGSFSLTRVLVRLEICRSSRGWEKKDKIRTTVHLGSRGGNNTRFTPIVGLGVRVGLR